MDSNGNGMDSGGSSNGTSDDHARSIQRALASLQLPHMPIDADSEDENADGSSIPLQTFRILVVADVDLSSASALAEYTLQQKNQVFDASRIDLCIACGPFCQDQDLLPYLRGKQKTARQNLHQSQLKSPETAASTPFFRSKEETVALEGLMTAALSQLESIVCRVVYCPGSSDPLTTLLSAKRLTPNSRNVHRQWLPMVPGLGCAALFYLDAPQILMAEKSSSGKKGGGGDGRSYEDEYEDPQDNTENDQEDTMALLTEQLIGIQQRYV
jgi:hypothetical protein